MAQDDYFYEIQLTNKQLVFYFLAGATGLILSFLAGVMVGRGVDQGAGEVHAARPAGEERVIAEETPKPLAAPSAEDLTYAQRLESEKPEEGLDKSPGPAPAGKTPPSTVRAAAPRAAAVAATTPPPTIAEATLPPAPQLTGKPAGVARGEPLKPSPAAKPSPAVAAAPKGAPPVGGGHFTIQVGAFKERSAADSMVGRLKKKGFAAYVVSPEGEGLFNVRVGNFVARADAERVQARLRDEEKFKPFIVKP